MQPLIQLLKSRSAREDALSRPSSEVQQVAFLSEASPLELFVEENGDLRCSSSL